MSCCRVLSFFNENILYFKIYNQNNYSLKNIDVCLKFNRLMQYDKSCDLLLIGNSTIAVE